MRDWTWDELGRLAELRMGQSPPGSVVVELRDGLPFLQGNAEFGSRSPRPRYQCNEAPRRAEPGDVLISVRAPVGAINIADQACGIGRGLAAVRFLKLDQRFGHHALQETAIMLNRLSQGTTFAAIGRTELASLRLPAPQLEEQRRIVEVLDTIDETIQATESVIAKRRSLRTGLAADLLRTPSAMAPSETSKPNEVTPPQASTRASSNSDMAEDGHRLSDYADLNSESLGTSTPGDLRFDYFDLSSVSNGSVIESRVETLTFSTAPSRARRIARKDDFLFGTVRPLQKSHAWAPRGCIASTGFAVVRAKMGLADSRFIGHFLLTEEATLRASQLAVGSGYPALGEKDLGEFAFPNFTLEEQQRIAEILDTLESTTEHNEAELAKLRELRAGLAADLLSGRVRTVAA